MREFSVLTDILDAAAAPTNALPKVGRLWRANDETHAEFGSRFPRLAELRPGSSLARGEELSENLLEPVGLGREALESAVRDHEEPTTSIRIVEQELEHERLALI
jgi:hypothetical protein